MSAKTAPNGVQYAEITAAIGERGAAVLVAALPGTRWYIPAALHREHPIVAAIGAPMADALAKRMHGTTLDVPTGDKAKRETRNARILAMFDAGQSTRDIALVVGLTQRAVRNIITKEQT